MTRCFVCASCADRRPGDVSYILLMSENKLKLMVMTYPALHLRGHHRTNSVNIVAREEHGPFDVGARHAGNVWRHGQVDDLCRSEYRLSIRARYFVMMCAHTHTGWLTVLAGRAEVAKFAAIDTVAGERVAGRGRLGAPPTSLAAVGAKLPRLTNW
jgi:hypothetical protein